MPGPQQAAQTAVRSFVSQLPDLVRQVALGHGLQWPDDGLVYQYTSIETLLSMIAPDHGHVDNHPDALQQALGHLWATAASYMNDAREFTHGRDVVQRAVVRVRRTSRAPNKPFLDLVRDAAQEAKGLDVFCACFSREPDHLGQWRGYGDGGRGCALGFDLAELRMRVNGICTWLIYGDENHGTDQRAVSNRRCTELVSILRASQPGAPADLHAYMTAARSELARVLPSVLLLFKGYAFHDELEHRVIYSDTTAPWPATVPIHGPHRCFRRVGSAVVPFVKLAIHGGQAPLREVRLGPASCHTANLDAVRSMLDRCGFGHIAVCTSEIPFVPR